MSDINSLANSLYYSSAIEASKLEAKKQSDIKSKELNKKSPVKSFSSMVDETSENLMMEVDIPEIKGMSFEQAEQFLIDEVYSKGDELKQSPVTENFLKYKKAIANFMKFVEKECYILEQEKGAVIKKKVNGRLKPKQKVYTNIKIVNEKLANLASDILFNQKDQLMMTAKINEITGLLVDVFY